MRSCQPVFNKNISNNQKFTAADIFLRTFCFKLFNKIETWECLNEALGEVSLNTYDGKIFSEIIDELIRGKKKPYSGAYIMPSGKKSLAMLGNTRIIFH